MAKSLAITVIDLSQENENNFDLIIPGYLRGTIIEHG